MNDNNIHCWIAGIGMVRIKLIDGRVITLIAVWYIPDLKKNILFYYY